MQRVCEEGAVLTCMVSDCSFNEADECLAPSITIGGDHAMCDMYTRQPVSKAESDAAVANCDIAQCAFNRLRACEASGVTVGMHSQHADCATFRQAR